MNCIFVVGAGGTGGYFIPNLINYLNLGKKPNDIFVMDGDRVEGKNLLRQGFFKADLGQYKADVLVNRYGVIARKHVRVKAINGFLNSALDFDKVIEEMLTKMKAKYTRVIIISCVDNNMARLRMLFGAYYLQDKYKIRVDVIDSGNAEWSGQTLPTVLLGTREDATARSGFRKTNNFLTGIVDAVGKGVNGLVNFKFSKSNIKFNTYYSIFTKMDNWRERLTRGEHELGCDEIVVSNPQNIGTNMMASSSVMLMLQNILSVGYEPCEYQFDASSNVFQVKNRGVALEEGYENRLRELVDYVATEEGFSEVFKPSEYALGSIGYLEEALQLLNSNASVKRKTVVTKQHHNVDLSGIPMGRNTTTELADVLVDEVGLVVDKEFIRPTVQDEEVYVVEPDAQEQLEDLELDLELLLQDTDSEGNVINVDMSAIFGDEWSDDVSAEESFNELFDTMSDDIDEQTNIDFIVTLDDEIDSDDSQFVDDSDINLIDGYDRINGVLITDDFEDDWEGND